MALNSLFTMKSLKDFLYRFSMILHALHGGFKILHAHLFYHEGHEEHEGKNPLYSFFMVEFASA